MRSDIVQALDTYKIKTFGNVKNIEKMEEILSDDETVLYITPTNAIIKDHHSKKTEKLPGIFAITTNRILFRFGILATIQTEIIPLSDIQSSGCTGNGLTGGHVTISTETKEFDFLVNYKKSVFQSVQKLLQQTINNYNSNTSNAVSNNSNDDILLQIQKLSELKEKNILSEEEFQSKKSELLSRL